MGGQCRPKLEILFGDSDIIKTGFSDAKIESFGGDDKIFGSNTARQIDADDGNDHDAVQG